MFKRSFRGGEQHQIQQNSSRPGWGKALPHAGTSCLPLGFSGLGVSVSHFSVQNRSVANSQTLLLTARRCLSTLTSFGCWMSELLQQSLWLIGAARAGLIPRWRQMPESEWMDVVKCGFGMYESLCSSCSVNYYDYHKLSSSCNCCSQSAGISQKEPALLKRHWIYWESGFSL